MFSQNEHKLNNNQGFTLVEILVVTALIIILSAIVIPRYRAGNQYFSVQRSAHQLSQDLRHVQEMAMGATEIGKGIVNPGDEFYPDGGFGIHFDINEPEHYIIFADCDPTLNLGYNGPIATPCGHGGFMFSELVEDVHLESKVGIESMSLPSPLYVIFRAPYPSILISGGGSEAEIDLWFANDNSKIKTVIVNEAGLIYVE